MYVFTASCHSNTFNNNPMSYYAHGVRSMCFGCKHTINFRRASDLQSSKCTKGQIVTMHLEKLKILMIGPSDSGKTTIANFLSESINIEEAGTPRPTQGVRIVEFELPNLTVNGKNNTIDIELWDCSGDHKFESCWPALRLGVQGAILVCSPTTLQAATREMELLYNYFVSQPKLSAKQCVLFYNCTNDNDDVNALNLSPTFSKVSQVAINLKSGGNRLKIDFSNYIVSVLQSINKDTSY